MLYQSNKLAIFKIYLKLKGFFLPHIKKDLKYLHLFCYVNFLQYVIKKAHVVYLPIRIKKYTVVRSPFVSKLSKEQFEIRTYKLLYWFEFPMKFYQLETFDVFYSYIKLQYFTIILNEIRK